MQCSSCHEPLPDGVPDGRCPACVVALLSEGSPPSAAKPSGRWPRRFGDYEILGKLGAGGMGVVYKARHRRRDCVVALKMIRSGQIGGRRRIERFRCEIETIARLDHPHIVPVYEVGEHRRRQFFSMLLVENGSLMTHLPRLQKDQRKSAQIMATVARAVHYAHQHGILHRDLKPANILLDSQDQPYVSDFGLARRIDDDARLTQPGVPVGTPSYMAPEQSSGKPAKGLPAADVYSLGAILYELLTGQLPFPANTSEAAALQARQQEPRPPRTLNPKVNPDLETICLKCLERDPSRRYPTAEALGLDLERVLRNEPIEAHPVGQFRGLFKCACRRPVAAGSIAAGILILLAVTVASSSFAIKLRGLLPPPPNNPPVVVIMDTTADRGKYFGVPEGGTNATVLSKILSDLPLDRHIEPLAHDWDDEAHVLRLRPDLVIVHKSALFHALNEKFDCPYPPAGKPPEGQCKEVYDTADRMLVAFLGLIGTKYPHTKFLVYSRGTDGLWEDPAERQKWIARAEQRFPALKNRITDQFVEGGVAKGSFDDRVNRERIRQNVEQLLGLPPRTR